MTSRPVLSILPTMALSLVLQAWVVAPSFALDLSILSDFGSSEIVHNAALVTQNGMSNRAQISQLIDAGGSTGHEAEINQVGSDNQALIEQSGDLNRARINQADSGNLANVTQTGFGNYLDLSQTGYGNSLYATQKGNNNSIIYSQPGSATANLVEIGNNNAINGAQPWGTTVNVRLEGNGLSVTVR